MWSRSTSDESEHSRSTVDEIFVCCRMYRSLSWSDATNTFRHEYRLALPPQVLLSQHQGALRHARSGSIHFIVRIRFGTLAFARYIEGPCSSVTHYTLLVILLGCSPLVLLVATYAIAVHFTSSVEERTGFPPTRTGIRCDHVPFSLCIAD
ncbi:hypothetical protein BKA93DRAFT_603672 [Sparassis latifolia]